jgi:DNA-binding LacI/PurR family transcriptional regulator/signal transduction histidine kinase/transcriptional regulator with GAF, ATPase, and Fis domain
MTPLPMHRTTPSSRQPLRSRPDTIGILVDTVRHGYQQRILRGAIRAAERYNVRLVCFCGLPDVSSDSGLNHLVSDNRIAGLIVLSGAVGTKIGWDEVKQFCRNLKPLPVVSIGLTMTVDGVRSVTADNKSGMAAAVNHLIADHSCNRIAFVGANANPEVILRLQGYREALNAQGLPFDKNYVVAGDLNKASGETACKQLFGHSNAPRRRHARTKFPDGIVAANDETAIGVLTALGAMGLHAPDDVAVIGFDDVAESCFIHPSLTTVSQPLLRQGEVAIDMMMDMLRDGSSAVDEQPLQTELVRRRSCRCKGPLIDADTLREQVQLGFDAERRGRTLGELGRRLLGLHPSDELIREIESGLRQLDISGCCISLFQISHEEPDTAKVLVACREGKRLESLLGRTFSPLELAPDDAFSVLHRIRLVHSLQFRTKHMGVCVFDIHPQHTYSPTNWAVCEEFAEIISRVLYASIQEQQQRFYNSHVRSLLDFKTAVEGILDVRKIAAIAAHKAREVTAATMGLTLLLDHATDTIASEGVDPESEPGLLDAKVRAAFWPKLATMREVAQVNNARTLKDWPSLNSSDARSMLSVPVKSRGVHLGVIGVLSRNEYAFSRDHRTFLEALSAQLANAIDRATLQSALLDMGRAWSHMRELDSTLEAVLGEINNAVGGDAAAVWFVDHYLQRFDLMAESDEPGVFRHFSQSLDSALAKVVSTSKVVQLYQSGNDRSDKEAGLLSPVRLGEEVVAVMGVFWRVRPCDMPDREKTMAQLGQYQGARMANVLPQRWLELAADQAIRTIGADSASVYVFRDSDILYQAGAGKATREFVRRFAPAPNGIGYEAIRDGKCKVLDNLTELGARDPTLRSEGVCALAAFPLRVGEGIGGLLYVNFWGNKERRITEDEVGFARDVVTKELVVAIENVVQVTEVRKASARRQRELAAIAAIDRAIAKGATGPDVHQLLRNILDEIRTVCNATRGQIYWRSALNNKLELRATDVGLAGVAPEMAVAVKGGIVDRAATERKSILVRDHRANIIQYCDVEATTRSVLVVPLVHEDETAGVVKLEDTLVGRFTPDDLRFVERLSHLAVIAVHVVVQYDQLRRQVRPFRALSVIAGRVLDAGNRDLDTVLRLVLSGVTAGQGACFSRAMLFLADSDSKQWRGRLAIGPSDQDRAQKVWDDLKSLVPDGDSPECLRRVLEWAEETARSTRIQPDTDSRLSLAVRGCTFTFADLGGPVADGITRGEASIIRVDQEDPIRDLIERVCNNGERGGAIACAPVIGRDRAATGLLIADNRFLECESYIGDGSLRALEAFAGFIAINLENARLASQLAKQQKLESWKEFASKTRHGLVTYLSYIEGCAFQIRSALRERDIDSARTFNDELFGIIEDAKWFLGELGEFSKELPRPNRTELNLVELIEVAVARAGALARLEIDFPKPDKAVILCVDRIRLSYAFMELIKNADDAMRGHGGNRKITLTLRDCSSNVVIEFRDFGPGIPPDLKSEVFSLGYTTKTDGTGLGLVIVSTICAEHHGTIDETGVFGEGARFVVTLPKPRAANTEEK